MVHLAVRVKIFHLVLFQRRSFYVFSRAKSDFGRGPVPQVAQLRLNKSAKVAWSAMLGVQHSVRHSVVYDYHPPSDVVSLHLSLVPFESQYVTNQARRPTS